MRIITLITIILTCYGFCYATEGYDDLVKLAKSGASEEIMIAYVDSSDVDYRLTADEITYLQDIGVTSRVISEIINHRQPQQNQPLPSQEPSEIPRAKLISPAEIPTETTENVQEEAPPPDNTDTSFFYDSLDPYGHWIYADDCWYWQPWAAEIDYRWRPYCDNGSWVYTDCGWAWHSNYSWGWAPFHYGRWRHHPHFGWIWAPDRVWGPAWVTWRCNDNYYGWAPLPPEARFEEGVGFSFHGRRNDLDFGFGLGDSDFFFVEGSHFDDRDLRGHRVRRTQVRDVFNNTTIINNNYEIRENRIINNGPSPRALSRLTGHEIKPIRVVTTSARSTDRRPVNILTKNEFTVFRPNNNTWKMPSKKERPHVSEETWRHNEQTLKAEHAEKGIPRALEKENPRPTEKGIPRALEKENPRPAEKGIPRALEKENSRIPQPRQIRVNTDINELKREHAAALVASQRHNNAILEAEKRSQDLERQAAREKDKNKREQIKSMAEEEKSKAEESKINREQAQKWANERKSMIEKYSSPKETSHSAENEQKKEEKEKR